MGQPSSGELERKRYAVEPTTDLRHGTGCLDVEFERWHSQPGPLHEELDGFQPEQLAKIKISSELQQLQ